jgi:hypothetical protein
MSAQHGSSVLAEQSLDPEHASQDIGLLCWEIVVQQQLRQIGDIRCNPSRLIFTEQFGRRAPSRLTLIIDVAQCLTVGVAHDETVRRYFGGPRRREAAGGRDVETAPAFEPLPNYHPALRRLRSLRSMWGLRLRSLLRSLRSLASVDCASSG